MSTKATNLQTLNYLLLVGSGKSEDQPMMELNFAVELYFTVDFTSLVQVLLDHTSSLVNIAKAYYIYVKATKLAERK